jgi:iron complex outermembrane recepter protein
MMSTKPILLSAAVVTLAAQCTQALAAEDRVNQARDDQFALEEVVVTAQKRGNQNLSDTPISIGVLSGDDFEANAVRDLSETLNTVGGVNLFSNSPGRNTISIRGAGNDSLFAGGSTTGFYLDETPFGFSRSGILPDANVYDLERVEVLRGPQGTLYGANSLNGTVRIITNDANLDEFEFKGRTNGSYTDNGGDNYSADLAINIPLAPGKIALRGVVSYAVDDGWIDSPSSNVIDGIAADNINGASAASYRLKLNAAPTDLLTVEAGIWLSRIDSDAPHSANENSVTIFSADQLFEQDFDIYSLEIGYDFETFSLLSASNVTEVSTTSKQDYLLSGVVPVTISPDNYKSEAINQEIRLVSSLDGNWQWSAGVSYRETDETLTQAVLNILPGVGEINDESQSWAVFGEVVFSFWDSAADLTLGTRYFDTTVTTHEIENLYLARPLLSAESSFDDVSPRVVLSFYPGDDITFYGSVSKGFRSGIVQSADTLRSDTTVDIEVDPDSLWSYELGAKGRVLGGRLSYDMAIYYIDWTDVQQRSVSPAGTATVRNIGNASGVGVDASVTATPLADLTLALSLGWNGLEFDDAVAPLPGVVFYNKGDRLNQSPEYTAGFHLNYIFDLGVQGLEGRLGGSVNYHSKLEQRGLNGTVAAFSESDEILKARINFAVEDEQWSAMLYIDNVTNEDGATNAPTIGTLPTQIRPRTVGLQVSYRY